jgi:hypothetical protein
LTARLRPNGTLTLNRNEPGYRFNDFGHYTEQFAASMAIDELLLQSVADVVRLFPAWPRDKPARFHQLRAQGGFLVSATCERGNVGPVRVESTAGGRLRLFSPWPGIEVVGPDAEATPWTPNEKGIVELDTQAGQTFAFRARKEPALNRAVHDDVRDGRTAGVGRKSGGEPCHEQRKEQCPTTRKALP